jgi:hypothetical protein
MRNSSSGPMREQNVGPEVIRAEDGLMEAGVFNLLLRRWVSLQVMGIGAKVGV